jgi:hypothetical protein
MAQVTRTRTATNTDAPAVTREPVAGNDHPLGGSPESADSFTHIGGDLPPAGPPVVETVDEDEEEKEDEDLTDRDEALSEGEGEEGSSYGGGSAFGPPALSDLIDLEHMQCCAPTQVTMSDGAKVPCVCGRSVGDCKRHGKHRIAGRYRHPVGSYVRVTDVGRGFQGHGLVGTFYTPEQVEKMRRQDLEEMENLTAGMADGTTDEEEESVNLARVSFGPNTDSPAARKSTRTPSSTQLRDDLLSTTRPIAKPIRDPSLWYGLVDVAGARWVFNDLKKAQAYVDTKTFRFARVFESKSESYSWMEGGREDPISVEENAKGNSSPSSSDSDKCSSDSSTDDDRKKKKKRIKKKKNRSSKKGHSEDKSQSDRKSKKDKRQKGKPPPPLPSSSSEDSSDESSLDSSSTGSDSDSFTKKKKSKKARLKIRRKKRRDRTRVSQTKFSGSDPSVGDRKRIFDLSINGSEIDAAAGPPHMRSKDATELYSAAVDVTSLPGMFSFAGRNGTDELYDEAQRTTEMAATLLSTAIGKKAQIHDSLWKTSKRHSMGTVKSMESLFKFVKSVGKSERPSFEQQENAIQVFMLSRHYDDGAITDYSQNGFLPRITQASFRYYGNMLSIIRQLAFDHPDFWEQGPAKAMLDFHSERLLQIRQNALTRKALILQTYTYLRDSYSKGFYHESMTESLWDRLALLSSAHSTDNGKGAGVGGNRVAATASGGDKTPRCSHCRFPKLHEVAKVRPSKMVCPVKDLSQKKARAIAKLAVEKWEKAPAAGGFQITLDEAIAEHKDEE